MPSEPIEETILSQRKALAIKFRATGSLLWFRPKSDCDARTFSGIPITYALRSILSAFGGCLIIINGWANKNSIHPLKFWSHFPPTYVVLIINNIQTSAFAAETTREGLSTTGNSSNQLPFYREKCRGTTCSARARQSQNWCLRPNIFCSTLAERSRSTGL